MLVVTLISGLSSMATRAGDTAGESEWAGEVTSRHGGEAVRIDAAGQPFTALLREAASRRALGGIVLLHGSEASPDASDLALALRKALPERGWTSLSLIAPVRETGTHLQAYSGLMREAVGRVAAGVSYLHEKPAVPIAIVGLRAGALTAVRYLAQNPDARAAAVVLINLPIAASSETERELAKLKLPVLDIVTDGAVRRGGEGALQRKGLMKNNARYQQIVIADTGARLQTLEGMLINRIHGWLKRELEAAESGAAQ